MTTQTHTDVLTQRGLATVAERAGWTPQTLRRDGNEYAGWQYPIYDVEGNARGRKRWKALNGQGPKYFWPQGQPENSKYYFLPGLKSAVLKAHGVLYIAGGEPDVLAYHAAGIENVWCWLAAEESVPASLVTDLQYLGATMVLYAPDRDGAGMRSAAKVYEMLDGTGIALAVKALPGDVGSKHDVNTLWISAGFDGAAFQKRLHELPAIQTVDLKLYAQQRGMSGDQAQRSVETDVKRWRNDWIETVTQALGQPTIKGGRSWWSCPLPSHADENPSFRISNDQARDFPWPVCTCGIQDDKRAWEMVADALNVDGWDDYKRQQAQASGVELGTRDLSRAPVEPDAPLWVSSQQVYAQLRAELKGEYTPEGSPIAFPLTALHQFGGFARYLWTGKTIGFGGISGGGKTMMLKSICQLLLLKGYDVIWWGPEWSPDEYGLQDLQRAGGLDFEQINSLRVIRAIMRDDECDFKTALVKSGIAAPAQGAVDESVALLEKMIAFPGRMFYIPDIRMTVENVMKTAKTMAQTLRSEGRKPAAFVFDYAQLANMPGKRDWTWGKRVNAEIKAGVAASEANLIGMVGIQSRKGDSEKVRQDGKRLTMDAAQGTDEQPFNLYITLTPEFKTDGAKYPHGIVSVEKNNMGRTGQARLHVKWAQLLVIDQIAAPPTTVDLAPGNDTANAPARGDA